SNNTRELSEALKRRCLFLFLDYPDKEREMEIVMSKVPGVSKVLADSIVSFVGSLRELDLKKRPSISETLDWTLTLLNLGLEEVDESVVKATINVLLKYRSDISKASKSILSS
ncbi:MAG: MoxR family ATPase, partial [Actinomycetota bacterium]|nr:MoxR family ATPase [Actinomycetota bacterium]